MKFQIFETSDVHQYQLGFDELGISLVSAGRSVQIVGLIATSNGVPTEPIQITISDPMRLEPLTKAVENELQFSENVHLYSSVLLDKSENRNWHPFKVLC